MRDKIVARMLHQDGNYWVYHKNFLDEAIDQVLEKKPEEKIWRVVRETRCPEMEIPCYRLMKKDLIKVGRVRFKIRDIMSPVYRDIEMKNDFFYEHHKEMYPSVIDESMQSMSHSVVHNDSVAEDVNNNGGANLGEVLQEQEDAALAEAQQNALLTESDHEDDEGPQHQNTHFIGPGMNDENADGEDIESANNTQFEASKLVTGIIHKKKASNLIATDQKLSELGEKKPL